VSTLISNHIYNKFGYSLGYYDIFNYSDKKALSDTEMANVIECAKDIEQQLGEKLIIVNQNNPKKFYKTVINELDKLGKFYQEKNGEFVEVKKIKAYTQDFDKFVYREPTVVVAITDTINKYRGYGNEEDYDAIRNFSASLTRQNLSLKCGVISHFVVQLDLDITKLKFTNKGAKLVELSKPSLGHIKTCRSIADDITLAFGLWDPLTVNVTSYLDYKNLDQMKDNWKFRVLIILKSREGNIQPTMNEIPLACDFSRDYIEELPAPDSLNITKYFNE